MDHPSNRLRFGPGDMVLIPPGRKHYITQDKKTHSHVIAVHFIARVFGAFDLLQVIDFPIILHRNEYLDHVKTSKRLSREFAVKAPAWQSVMDTEIRALLIAILRSQGEQCQAQMSSLPQLIRFRPVFQLIDENISDSDLTVQTMARAVFLSEVQFRKLFRRMTGMTPISFLQRRRIEHACQLLVSTEDSMEVIAEKCGFTQSSFFYRVFRRWTSSTPHAFRCCYRPV